MISRAARGLTVDGPPPGGLVRKGEGNMSEDQANPSPPAAPSRSPDAERLAVLVGTWHTVGHTTPAADEPALEIDATDTYEWLPGGAALLHTVDARVGEDRVEGAEIIGYEPAKGAYVTQYFGTDGPSRYVAHLEEVDGSLVWRMGSERDRFTGVFDADRRGLTGHWEQLADGSWRPWMEISLTRT
jgi:hypothetical protein